MATRGIVAGRRARITTASRCGLPTIPGAPDDGTARSYVFDALVSIQNTINEKEGEKQTSTSMTGADCVVYTPPTTIQDESLTITLCGVEDHVLSFLSSVVTVSDEAGDPEGYFTQKSIDSDIAFTLELWNAVGDAAECSDTPEDDSYFENAAAAGSTIRGYHVWPAVTNARLTGDVTYGLESANLVIGATAKFAPLYGKGPYDVRRDALTGDPTRLLEAFNSERISYHGKTLLAEPALTTEPTVITRPDPYFGAVTP